MNADSEQDAILEAIFAAPDDDTPRLVYADWLDEHGEPEQAEFVRAQIELARQPNTARQKREAAAWEKLARRWDDLCAPKSLFRKEDFRRGLVLGSAELASQITVERFVELSDRLWPRIPLRNLILMFKGQVASAFFDCAHLRRLTGLAILNGNYHAEVMPEEFAVRLFSCDPFARLEWLVATRVPMTRRVLDALRATPYFPRLRSLGIDYLGVRDGAMHNGQLRFPAKWKHPLGGGLAKRPGGAVKAVAKTIPALEEELVTVPPGETSCVAIVEHIFRIQRH